MPEGLNFVSAEVTKYDEETQNNIKGWNKNGIYRFIKN